MTSIIDMYTEKVRRWENAIEYFEKPYTEKWTGKKFDEAIDERERHYLKLLELLAELNKLHAEVFNV
jgi:hypothetical protein